jgi:hypothetical protein
VKPVIQDPLEELAQLVKPDNMVQPEMMVYQVHMAQLDEPDLPVKPEMLEQPVYSELQVNRDLLVLLAQSETLE